MSSRALIIAVALLAAGANPGLASDLHRGTYYQNPEFGFALWIPAGYTAAEPRAEQFLAYFSGGGDGSYAVEILKPEERSQANYVDARLKQARDQFPSGETEVIRDVDAGGRSAVVIVLRKLDGNPKFKGTELVQALVPLKDAVTLPIIVYNKAGGWKNGVEVVRWVLATLRYLGGDGSLDEYLAGRRVHAATGLSFRPPRGFREDSHGDASVLYSGSHPASGMRATLATAEAPSLEAALTGSTGATGNLKTWALPAPEGLVLRGTFVGSDRVGLARVAAEFSGAGGPRFLVSVTGKPEHAETMLRAAELMGLSLARVDVAAARDKAGAAVAALESALRRRQPDAVKAHVKELCELVFLEPVAETLLKTLPRLDEPSIQIMAARAIATQELPALAPQLLKTAKNGKIRINPPVLAAVLEALGSSRTKNAISFLLGHATRGDNRVSAAAVRALGRYVEHRERVVKRLVKQMERSESAARRTDYAARERWDAIRPAFQEALKNLTGEQFRTAEEASLWLRNQRF